jgi:hypothetical protein
MDKEERELITLMLDGYKLTNINVDLEIRKKKLLKKFDKISYAVDELNQAYEIVKLVL